MTLCITPSGQQYMKPDFFVFFTTPNTYHFNGVSLKLKEDPNYDEYESNSFDVLRYYALTDYWGIDVQYDAIFSIQNGEKSLIAVADYDLPRLAQKEAVLHVSSNHIAVIEYSWENVKKALEKRATRSAEEQKIGDAIKNWEEQSLRTYEDAKKLIEKKLKADLSRDSITVQVAGQQWLAYSTRKPLIAMGYNQFMQTREDPMFYSAATVRAAPFPGGWAVEINFQNRFLLCSGKDSLDIKNRPFPTTEWEDFHPWRFWKWTGDAFVGNEFFANLVDEYDKSIAVAANKNVAFLFLDANKLIIVNRFGTTHSERIDDEETNRALLLGNN